MKELINLSFPSYNSLDLTSLSDRVILYYKENIKDIDILPGSVGRDLILNPSIVTIALVESTILCLLGDLLLENVSNGNICDCDFVKSYLKNLGYIDKSNLKSQGNVRLYFSKPLIDNAYNQQGYFVISSGMTYTFDDESFFKLFYAQGEIKVYLPSSSYYQTNSYRLSIQDEETYFIDIDIEGSLTTNTAVPAGSGLNISDNLVGFVRCILNNELRLGNPEKSVVEMLSSLLNVFFLNSLSTKGGIVSFVRTNILDVNNVFISLTGDAEMTRLSNNLLGFLDSKVDVYSKDSQSHYGQLTEYIFLKSIDLTLPALNQKFFNLVTFQHIPLVINKISWGSGNIVSPQIFSYSKDLSKGIYGDVVNSKYEGFLFVADSTSGALPSMDYYSSEYSSDIGIFLKVDYTYEFSSGKISILMESPDNVLLNSSLIVKSKFPIELTELKLYFDRKNGSILNVNSLRNAILDKLNTLENPIVYDFQKISDYLRYYGLNGLLSFECSGKVHHGITNSFVFTQYINELVSDTSSFVQGLDTSKYFQVNSNDTFSGIDSIQTLSLIGYQDASGHLVVTKNNSGCLINKDDIHIL